MEPDEEDDSRLCDDLKGVLRKSEELADALHSLQSTNSSLKFYANKLLVKLNEFTSNFSDKKPTTKCNICYVRNKTHALIGCGHSMCLPCITRCQTRNQCFVCRAAPEGVLKIFI
jgi:hypothetical protein